MRRLRAAKGWTQERLAAEADLARNYIGNLERSEKAVSVDVLDQLAKALGVAAHELLAPPPKPGDR